MTTTDRTAPTQRARLTPLRRTSLVAGALYLLTFISIPTLGLYAAVRDPNYILGAGPDTPVYIGVILELIVALAGIGTAVALYPVLKRQNEGVALALVGSRTVEAATIFSGVVTLLAVVTLRHSGVGADAQITSSTLVTLHDWTFILGQSLMPAANGLLLGSLLYQSRLVPRALPVLGFVGAGLLLTATTAQVFGVFGYGSPITGLMAIPIAAWEFSLGVYLVVKGFKPCAITAEMVDAAAPRDLRVVVS